MSQKADDLQKQIDELKRMVEAMGPSANAKNRTMQAARAGLAAKNAKEKADRIDAMVKAITELTAQDRQAPSRDKVSRKMGHGSTGATFKNRLMEAIDSGRVCMLTACEARKIGVPTGKSVGYADIVLAVVEEK